MDFLRTEAQTPTIIIDCETETGRYTTVFGVCVRGGFEPGNQRPDVCQHDWSQLNFMLNHVYRIYYVYFFN